MILIDGLKKIMHVLLKRRGQATSLQVLQSYTVYPRVLKQHPVSDVFSKNFETDPYKYNSSENLHPSP